MKNIFKRCKAAKKNNRGMTLVEIIVASTIFGILASMVAYVYNSSVHNQLDTEKWNNQTDAQASYIAEYRNDTTNSEFNDNHVGGGATQYQVQVVFGDGTTIQSNNVDMYYIETQHPTNNGNQIPTDETVHIKFFRVS